MLENIKRKWQKRIEKNAFKSTLTYTDPKGKQKTEKVYFKRSQFPFFEWFGDWGRIYPPINEDESVNRMNLWFGGWRNLIKLLLLLGLIALVLFQFYTDFTVIEHLKEVCQQVGVQ